MKPEYENLLPVLRDTAQKYGYALGLHGSGERDLDLIAVPWVEDASNSDTLVKALQQAVNGHISVWEGHNPMVKPHGRLAWSIRPLENNPRAELYIDLSVMPLKEMSMMPILPSFPCPQCQQTVMIDSPFPTCACGAKFKLLPAGPEILDPRIAHQTDDRLTHGDAGKADRLDRLRNIRKR